MSLMSPPGDTSRATSPNGHDVSGSAGQNEDPEESEHPSENQVLAPPEDMGNVKGMQKYAKRDKGIGRDVQPKSRVSKEAMTVRHEVRIEELPNDSSMVTLLH